MIDYLKIAIFDPDLIDKVWNNPLLEYFSEMKKRITTDEITQTKKKSYRNLIFEKHPNCLIITGSIHKFFNEGIHNANDLSFVNSIKIIHFVTENLNLDLSKCIIQNLEFGLNILPKIAIKDIINWLKYHERNEFNKDPELQYSKRSQKYNPDGKPNNYKVIKAYAKGQQKFNGRTYTDPNTGRFEVRSKQAKYFNKLGIYTLADLIKPDIYLTLSNELIKEFENVLILDKQLQGKDKKLDKFLNQDFWEDCINGHRNMFAKQKQTYFKLVNSYPENIHSELKQLIKSKLDSFTTELKTGAISTASTKGLKVHIPKYIRMENAPIHTSCKVTGLTIYDQRPETTNLTARGVKWYYENEPETYKKKLKSLLTEKWLIRHKGEPMENYFSEIYHMIRNKKMNPKNNTFKSYQILERKGLKLFSTVELLPPEKLKLIKNELQTKIVFV
ncbi:MAG: hypothetical protein JZU47_07845 [Prolixibacteraceae bacterium]|nr:hypothetical protein [Prolixibacteraceae bacterium]